jgi:hypothetical protein
MIMVSASCRLQPGPLLYPTGIITIDAPPNVLIDLKNVTRALRVKEALVLGLNLPTISSDDLVLLPAPEVRK